MNSVKNLYYFLDTNSRQKMVWLILFSIGISAIETVGISIIMPFIDVATNFTSISENKYYSWLFNFFSFESNVDFAIAFGIFLICFFVFRVVIHLIYNYLMAHFAQNIYAKLTKQMFKVYLDMPYITYINKNSSYLTKAIITEASLVSNIINSILLVISEFFVIIFLYVLMLVVSWEITLAFTVIVGVKVLLLSKTVSRQIKRIGIERERGQLKLYEIINRIFSDFKQIKLQDKDRIDQIKHSFSQSVKRYTNANAMHSFFDLFPRLFLELIGFSLVTLLIIIYLYLNDSNVAYIMPTLSLFVLALYRLLPSVNRILHGYNSMIYHYESIGIVKRELGTEREYLKNETVEFNRAISLNDVEFSYQGRVVLKGVNLIVRKGEKVAFIGESGSGKSTLLDLIVGLNQPTAGNISVDQTKLGKENLLDWRSKVGYISQQIYLFDGTVEENVCFGRPVNEGFLEQVLVQANIFDFLQTKNGLKTLVGEGGIQLSGGQKQRIAIARALYGRPEIIVLDEATSALDFETEKKIMNEIYNISADKTLLIVAHRLTSLKDCDRIVEVHDGKLTESGL